MAAAVVVSMKVEVKSVVVAIVDSDTEEMVDVNSMEPVVVDPAVIEDSEMVIVSVSAVKSVLDCIELLVSVVEDAAMEPDTVSAEVAKASALLPLETLMGLQGPAATPVIPIPARPAIIFLGLTMIAR